jgi:hypothetical protein
MKLVFLYVRNRRGDFFAERVKEEGYYYLIKRMVETGIVDNALIVIESPEQKFIDYEKGIKGLIINDMNRIDRYLMPGDIIWCRGGWKNWHDPLKKLGDAGHWLMMYAANTGREKWTLWDVILDDLSGGNFIDDENRFHLYFRKPLNPSFFYPHEETKKIYDICIGASNIHDKKGQWRAIEVMVAYKEIFGIGLKAVMPGSIRGGENTEKMLKSIDAYGLDVTMPGELTRSELCKVYNQSRIFIHLGSHGQGDRGPMEAMKCGCFLTIGFPQYHAPWVCSNYGVCYVPIDPEDYQTIAFNLWGIQPAWSNRKYISDYHERCASIEDISLPAMKKLFDFFRANPKADRNTLKKEMIP